MNTEEDWEEGGTDEESSAGEGVHVFDDGESSFLGERDFRHVDLEEVDALELKPKVDEG